MLSAPWPDGRPLLLATLLALPLTGGAAEDPAHQREANLTVDVTALYNDNLARAQRDVDIADDSAVEANVAISDSTSAITGQSFSFEWSGKAVQFDRFDGLDHAAMAFKIGYRRQFARGFYAPVYQLSLKAARLFHDSELRDGYSLEFGGMATRRFSDRWTGRTGFSLLRRSATDGDVFDIERNSLFVNLDARLSPDSLGYITWIGAKGDVVSTAQPTFTIVDNAEAIEPDTAFGGIPENRFAYRLDADVHILTLGVNFSIGSSTSIDLSAEALTAEATDGIDYQRNIGRMSLLHRF